MGDKTGIEWTDSTWNPTTGCDKVSSGCDNCYALGQAKRLKAMGQANYQRDGDSVTSGPGFGFTEHPHMLDKPLRWARPRRIFVNSMSDLFHQEATRGHVTDVFAVMALASHHTYQVLTKRPAKMRSWLAAPAFQSQVRDAAYRMMMGEHPTVTVPAVLADAYGRGVNVTAAQRPWPLPNVWVGTSVEDQATADLRIRSLLDTPAAVRFVSMEPLLGEVDLTRVATTPWGPARSALTPVRDRDTDAVLVPGLDWVIVGGESGPNARPMHPRWAERVRDACAAAGVPFHFKQWGEWSPLAPLDAAGRYDFDHEPRGALSLNGVLYEPGSLAYPDGPRRGEATRENIRGAIQLTNVYRVGKKAAGRSLAGDDTTDDGYPTA